MDSKTIITYAGDATLFKELEAGLVQAIPKESTEWRRQFGRVIKTVYVEAVFVPFSNEIVPKSDDLKLINEPILHTYWTECSDLENYKTNLKDDIEQWQKSLNGADWMIILVEVYDIRKSNKLIPRATVLDKIRADFAAKQGDRVISVIHPIKSESKSAESWRGLVNRVRVLLLAAYNRTLTKFEENVRAHRECRPQPTWSFCCYFLMQEELALALEMLGLYEEALVQYDELDALFTQFVLNSTKGESPKWLNSFMVPLQQWAGPTLNQRVTQQQRDLIRCSKLDLLQFRSYLFARQCSLLLMLCKPWEMAQRTLAFLHNSVNELNILEVNAPEGAVACWVFLGCLEILHKCDNYNDSAQVEAYSLYTADLWAYARDKLKALGELCGLVPGPGPTSEQLHIVVGLSSGMGDPPPSKTGPSPVDKLKEALSSKDVYNNYFLELSELSISTYKHIGRMRSARLIGCDLANFYLALNQPDKAATFLTGSVAGFSDDHWTALTADTQLKLVECCSYSPGDIKYITSCASVASSELDNSVRLTYFHRFIECLNKFAQDKAVVSNLEDIADIKPIAVRRTNQISEGECVITACVELVSRLPGPVQCVSMAVSLMREPEGKANTDASPRVDEKNCTLKKLPIFALLDYKQDSFLSAAHIACVEPHKALRRTDSHGRGRKVSTPTRHDYTMSLASNEFTLHPGANAIPVTWTTREVGQFRPGQVSVVVRGVELLAAVPAPAPCFTVQMEKSSVELHQGRGELLAGLTQCMELVVHSGSYRIEEGTVVKVECSQGLTAAESAAGPMGPAVDIALPSTRPFEKVSIGLVVLAQLPSQGERDTTAIDHTITVKCLWCDETITTSLVFHAPLKSLMRLHTAHHRKFLQVSIKGLSSQRLVLRRAELAATNTREPIIQSLNSTKGLPQVVGSGLSVSLLWELNVASLEEQEDLIKFAFSLEYAPTGDDETTSLSDAEYRTYKCHFDVQKFKTLFIVRCSLEPGRDADFCRVGAMCQLNLEVSRCGAGDEDWSLMYEVHADQTLWAVCGRAAGVITLDKETKQSVSLDVMPLTQGFLTLPLVRLSKYIPATEKESNRQETSRPRLETFGPGQVYSASKSRQVHVLPAAAALD